MKMAAISTNWREYRKKNAQLLRPYESGEDLTGVSVSAEDTPALGGMIAVNPDNPADKWYVNQEFFEANYEPVGGRLDVSY